MAFQIVDIIDLICIKYETDNISFHNLRNRVLVAITDFSLQLKLIDCIGITFECISWKIPEDKSLQG